MPSFPPWFRLLLLFLLYLLVPFLRHFSLWHPDPQQRWFLYGDVYPEYWPDLHVAIHALRSGEWPLWNPFLSLGFPMASDPQVGIAYPLSWLYLLPAMLWGPSFGLFEAFTILPISLFGFGLHLFLRSHRLSHKAAFLGGLLAMSGGFVSIYGYLKFMHTIAWIPWIFLCLENFLEERKSRASGRWGVWRGGVALGMLLGVAALSGAPGGVFYLLFASSLYGGFRLIQKGRTLRGIVGVLRSLLPRLGVAAFWSLGLFAVILLPTLEILPFTKRLGGGYIFMAERGFSWEFWWGLLAPDLPLSDDPSRHGQLFFHGVLALFLSLIGLLLLQKERLRIVFFFLALGGFGLLLSTGDQTHTIALLYYLVPGASLFRAPERYAYLLNIALPITAAFGMQAILDLFSFPSIDRLLRLQRFLLFLSLGSLGGIGFFFLGLFPPDFHLSDGSLQSLAVFGLGLLLFGLCSSLALRKKAESPLEMSVLLQRQTRGSRIPASLGAVILLLAVAETYPWQNYRYFFPFSDFQRWSNPLLREEARGPLSPYRVMNDIEPGSRNASGLYAVRDVFNYPNPLLPERTSRLLQAVWKDPHILRFFNVHRILIARPSSHFFRTSITAMSPHAFQQIFFPHPERLWQAEAPSLEVSRFRLRDPAPRLLWLPSVHLVSSLDESLAIFREGDPWYDATIEPQERAREPRLYSLLAAQPASLPKRRNARKARKVSETQEAQEKFRGIAGLVTRGGFHTLEGRIEVPRAGVVIFNETWYPGWKAWIGQTPTPTFRINGLLCGILIPAGVHTIRFEYRPRGYPWVWFLWIAFLGLGLATVLWRKRGYRRGGGRGG